MSSSALIHPSPGDDAGVPEDLARSPSPAVLRTRVPGWRRHVVPALEWSLGVLGLVWLCWQVLVPAPPVVITLEPLDVRQEREWRAYAQHLSVQRTHGAIDLALEQARHEALVAAEDQTARVSAVALSPPPSSRGSGSGARPPRQPVDINRASSRQLQRLPGIGPAMADRIIDGRPFLHVDDLRRVRGIGPATLERLRPWVTVGSVDLGR